MQLFVHCSLNTLPYLRTCHPQLCSVNALLLGQDNGKSKLGLYPPSSGDASLLKNTLPRNKGYSITGEDSNQDLICLEKIVEHTIQVFVSIVDSIGTRGDADKLLPRPAKILPPEDMLRCSWPAASISTGMEMEVEGRPAGVRLKHRTSGRPRRLYGMLERPRQLSTSSSWQFWTGLTERRSSWPLSCYLGSVAPLHTACLHQVLPYSTEENTPLPPFDEFYKN